MNVGKLAEVSRQCGHANWRQQGPPVPPPASGCSTRHPALVLLLKFNLHIYGFTSQRMLSSQNWLLLNSTQHISITPGACRKIRRPLDVYSQQCSEGPGPWPAIRDRGPSGHPPRGGHGAKRSLTSASQRRRRGPCCSRGVSGRVSRVCKSPYLHRCR